MLISISGSTCVGKSTLINQLMGIPNLRECSLSSLEPAEKNPFLYKKNSVFQSQIFFYAEYLKKVIEYSQSPMSYKYIFLDRCIDEYELITHYRFKLGELSTEETALCLSIAQNIKKISPPINKIIYLYCSTETILERQAARDKNNYYSEKTIALLNSMYHEWAAHQTNILYVNTEKPINLEEIMAFISEQ